MVVDNIELGGGELSCPPVFGAPEFSHDLLANPFRIDLGDVDLSDHLFRSVACQCLRPFIKDDDVALHIGGDDPVHRTFDQIHEEFIGLSQLSLHPLPVGDVDIEPFVSDNLTLLIPFDMGGEKNGDLLTTLLLKLHL